MATDDAEAYPIKLGSKLGIQCTGEVTLESGFSFGVVLLRKEVIQPQVPLRLPCYDFTPIMNYTLGGCSLAVSAPTSSATHFRDVTGGVYKARERIHRIIADTRLLAIPAS